MRESYFKSKVRKDFLDNGWLVVQHTAGSGIPHGFPDTEFLSPTGYACKVEFKKSKNAKKQPLQDYWHEKLNKMGHDTFFVYPDNYDEWRRHVITISNSRGLPTTTGE